MSASSISSPAQGSPAKAPRVPSCILCQNRKVKCDRKEPCSGCVKAGVECVPSLPVSVRRRRRNIDEGQLAARLRRCEELLRGYDGNASTNNTIPTANLAQTPGTSTSLDNHPPGQEQSMRRSKVEAEAGTMILEHGRPRFVDNNLWASLSDEFRDLKEMLQSPPQNSNEGSPAVGTNVSDSSTLLLGSLSPNTHLSNVHPPTVQIFRLWQTFLDNVNPLSKILHAPSWQTRVLEASENIDSVPRTTELVLFAIYTAAVASLTNEECENLMGDSKRALLRRYSAATHQALVEIGFMRTTDIVVLQGFALFLLARRQEHDPHELWILSGVAIRIAQRIGVHRDGVALGLSPFETEMRRRLWWQIVLLDNRNAQLSGASTSSMAVDWDTKVPSNFNDADLFPGMLELPLEHSGQTEMTFCLVICEIAKYFKNLSAKAAGGWGGQSSATGTVAETGAAPTTNQWQSPGPSSWNNVNEAAASNSWQPPPNAQENINNHNSNATYLQHSAGGSWQSYGNNDPYASSSRDKLMNDLENHIENKFLRFCDPSIPLHQIAIMVARCMILTMKLKARHPRQRPDKGAGMLQAEKDSLFELSLKIIEYDVQGHKLPNIKRFVWHINVYFQLETFVFMLSELNHRPVGVLSNKAWQYVEEVYRYHPEILMDEGNSLYLAIGSLTLKAWRVRELEFVRQFHKLPETPKYISTLRSQQAAQEPSSKFSPSDHDDQGHESVSLYGASQSRMDTQTTESMAYSDMPMYDEAIQMQYGESVMDMEAMDWDYWNQLLASDNQGFPSGGNGQPSVT